MATITLDTDNYIRRVRRKETDRVKTKNPVRRTRVNTTGGMDIENGRGRPLGKRPLKPKGYYA